MKKRIVITVFALLILAALTNPSEDSFNKYINHRMEKKSDNKIEGIINKGLAIQSNITTDYSSYALFSISKTTIGTSKKTYFGIFGLWF